MKKHDIFWGLLFILAAAVIILKQFDILIDVSMFKLVVTVLLGFVIIKSVVRLNFWGILFPLALISILYSEEWNIARFTPWPALFTAFLLSLGFSILFKRDHYWWGYANHHSNAFSSNVVNEKDDKIINCTTSFGECIKYVNSEDFEKANVNCSFGKIKVYFDNTSIPSGKADIDLNVSFGSAKLYIPKSWRVVCKANVSFGDINYYSNQGSESPVVTIQGSVSFGDAKIIYV